MGGGPERCLPDNLDPLPKAGPELVSCAASPWEAHFQNLVLDLLQEPTCAFLVKITQPRLPLFTVTAAQLAKFKLGYYIWTADSVLLSFEFLLIFSLLLILFCCYFH